MRTNERWAIYSRAGRMLAATLALFTLGLTGSSTPIAAQQPQEVKVVEAGAEGNLDGAINVMSNGSRTGILFNDGTAGQIYVDRDELTVALPSAMRIAGAGGLRVVDREGDSLVRIGAGGGVYWMDIPLHYVALLSLAAMIFLSLVLVYVSVRLRRLSQALDDVRRELEATGRTS